MNVKKMILVYCILRSINLLERLLNYLFVSIRSIINGDKHLGLSTANDPVKWEKVYLTKANPVREINNEISKLIIDLSRDGETVLETGCGSGVLSAEIALADRDVSVCDFSQPILDRVKLLFKISRLNEPKIFHVDLTKPLPFEDNQFDVIWNSGVLEHWTDDELRPIIIEIARCAKRCVIALVPNERSVFYRYGRESAEKHGIAPWGREMPRSSLKNAFENAGLINVKEWCVCVKDAPNLIGMTDPVFQRKIKKWWNSIPDDDPVKNGQGYLLLTVGYKKTK